RSKRDWSSDVCSSDLYQWAAADQLRIYYQNELQGEIQWSLQGEHNARNALAAIAASQHVGITAEQACAALSDFQGIKRRMEHLRSEERRVGKEGRELA